jgi:hypothetical protein
MLIGRETELAFFTNHPAFRGLNASLYGVENLSKKLTTVLVTKIKQELVCRFLLAPCVLNPHSYRIRLRPAFITIVVYWLCPPLLRGSVFVTLPLHTVLSFADSHEADRGAEAERSARPAARHAQGLHAAQVHRRPPEAAGGHHAAVPALSVGLHPRRVLGPRVGAAPRAAHVQHGGEEV